MSDVNLTMPHNEERDAILAALPSPTRGELPPVFDRVRPGQSQATKAKSQKSSVEAENSEIATNPVHVERTSGQGSEDQDELDTVTSDDWLSFDEAFVGLGGQIVPKEALMLLLSREGGVWADDDTLAHLPKYTRAESVWEAEIGVCLADVAIAETGTLLVSSGPGRGRLTSLAPPVNVILIRKNAIVGTPEAAFAQLPEPTCVMISGTSRTGDIEGILIRGVHGPRELYLVRI